MRHWVGKVLRLAKSCHLGHQPHMISTQSIICIGAAHWDIIGHSPRLSGTGQDVPGVIRRTPGGVALNIAVALARQRHAPTLISVIGKDQAGDQLLEWLGASGVITNKLKQSDQHVTDSYLALEGPQGLIGAVAVSNALESLSESDLPAISVAAGDLVILDSGLSLEFLTALSRSLLRQQIDLRLTAAAPAKADRLATFFGYRGCTFYLNLEEAARLCASKFDDGPSAAHALLARGAERVLITDGSKSVTDADTTETIILTPPAITAQRVTGAGDIFAATHISSELGGMTRHEALVAAITAASAHVASPPPPYEG